MRFLLVVILTAAAAWGQERVVVRAGTLLDGRGAVLRNQQVVIEGGKIVSVGPTGTGKVDYDLSGATVMPGWIDTHVHLQWHMDANHKAVAGG